MVLKKHKQSNKISEKMKDKLLVIRQLASLKPSELILLQKRQIQNFNPNKRLAAKERLNLHKALKQYASQKITGCVLECKSIPLVVAQLFYKTLECCINYLRSSRQLIHADVDSAVKRFSSVGKIRFLQNHWYHNPGQENSPESSWVGALVYYCTKKECEDAMKSFFVHEEPGILPISISEHLLRIGEVESEWLFDTEDDSKNVSPGSSILVSGPSSSTCVNYIRDYVKRNHNNPIVFWCKRTSEPLQNLCVITYRYTVEAYAAAMDLDGKTVKCSHCRRCRLSARMKMEEKEWYIHFKTCEKW